MSALDIAEVRRREESFLANIASAQDDYDWLREHEGWKALGWESFADWWEGRVRPIMRGLSMRPTRELSAQVVEQVRAEEAELPPAQRRTRRELGELAGVSDETVARWTNARSTPATNVARADLEAQPAPAPLAADPVEERASWQCFACMRRFESAENVCPRCGGFGTNRQPVPEPPADSPSPEPAGAGSLNTGIAGKCEKCGTELPDDQHGYKRCDDCDSEGEHVAINLTEDPDGPCARCFIPWTDEEATLRKRLESGETVVVSLRSRHDRLTAWAEQQGLFVRIDRRTEWGNPFEMPADGDRDTVIARYAEHYIPFKAGLLAKVNDLRGKALGCWCAPDPCHGHVLRWLAEADGDQAPTLDEELPAMLRDVQSKTPQEFVRLAIDGWPQWEADLCDS